MRSSIIVFLSLLSLFIFRSSGAKAETPSNQLNQLKKQITQIKSTLSQAQTKRQNYLQQLQQSETNAGILALSIKQSKQTLKNQQQQINALQKQAENLGTQLSQQRNLIKKQLRHAYMTGREPYLKLLLSQKNLDDTNRTLMYYSYINKDRKRTIATLNATLTKISANQTKQNKQQTLLKTTYQKLITEQQQAIRLNQQRQTIINNLNTKINSNRQRLSQLQSNKAQLEKTLNILSRNLQNHNFLGQFRKLKGTLPWPTHGKILQSFGRKIGKSELHYSGVVIQAPEGQEVHAIAKGKLVFAKWMPGYGLLLIIDHGNGYMSLYGRMRSIYKKPGDPITQNAVIGTAGKSGGYTTSALYFAIRHNAKPLNPTAWCRKQT